MLEPGEDLDLQQKALGARPDEDLGTQDLDRDRAVVLPVASQVHYRHAAPAQQSVDRVTVAQRERLQDGLVTAILHGGKLIHADGSGSRYGDFRAETVVVRG